MARRCVAGRAALGGIRNADCRRPGGHRNGGRRRGRPTATVAQPEIGRYQTRSVAGGSSFQALIAQMRIHVQMRLRLVAEDLHLVLIETLLRAELQLRGTILEVHIAYRVPHMLAPVTGFRLLE